MCLDDRAQLRRYIYVLSFSRSQGNNRFASVVYVSRDVTPRFRERPIAKSSQAHDSCAGLRRMTLEGALVSGFIVSTYNAFQSTYRRVCTFLPHLTFNNHSVTPVAIWTMVPPELGPWESVEVRTALSCKWSHSFLTEIAT